MSENKADASLNPFFYQLAENARHIVFAYDLTKDNFLYLNPFFEEIWGLQKEDVMRDPTSIISTIHPEDKDYVIRYYHQMQDESAEKNIDIEFRIQLEDKSVRWLHFASFAYHKEGNQRVIAGLIDDITDFKENAQVLNKFAAKKNAVLEILSHDLSRPLANIQGLSTLLADLLEPYDEEKVEKIVDMIARSSKQGIELIRSFVQEEFLESVQAKLIKKRVNLIKELELLISEYQRNESMIKKKFYFKTSSDSIHMRLDDAKFMQVINNLFSNSIKFTTDGGEITLTVADQTRQVLITVQDNGIGIPEHLQEGLFEKYPNARRKGLKGEPSTGLGMSIIRQIVEWHGGSVWFESEENKGSTFFIQLPKE